MDPKNNITESRSPAGLNPSRRSFLKATLATTALSAVPLRLETERSRKSLPAVPSASDLAGSHFTHRMRDLYSNQTAQNELGYAQAAKSVAGITAIGIPPFGCCGVPETPWSPGFLLTCEIFLNGQVLLSFPDGDKVQYQWFPHRIVRETSVNGLVFKTEMFMPAKQRAVAQVIRVRNTGTTARAIKLGFDMRAAVASKPGPWFTNSPGEADNQIEFDSGRGCLTFAARHSQAVSVQGLSPKPDRVADARTLMIEWSLGPGETRELHYVNAIDQNRQSALDVYDALQKNFSALVREHEQAFNGLIRSAFTPGNADFSGHLPQLETNDESLWDLYHAGFRNLLFARRASPDSAYGTTYLTLGGRVIQTLSFPWDTSLTSLSLALLDPDALRRLVEAWFVADMHQHLATDYLTGQPMGPWYAVNDMAISRCAQNFLRVSGDFAWLDKRVGDKSVLDHLIYHATYWKELDKGSHGLGDYGKLENNLEVVSTYLHESAGMNAGNVSSLRFVAELLDRRGDSARASQLRGEAKELAQRINQKLYVAGKGYWQCGYPDASFVEVRHCYDFLSVLDNMAGDLTASQKREMDNFFWQELHSDYWMRALSPNDVDATWNIRPDHSWLGAYCAWPPMTAKGLYKTGSSSQVAAWLKNVAKAGNQGPIGQAHFVESAFPLEGGAAYKCPYDLPYMNDWCCIAGGAFTDLVIDSIFGAQLTLGNGVYVETRLADFDANARLRGLRHQGKNYDVSAKGAVLAG
jgi:TAT (twin-arginine translocation) pathway-exported protein